MLPEEAVGGAVHCVWIQRITEGMHVTAEKRTHDRLPPYPILVCFGAGRPPRVEILGSFLDSKYADLPWKQRIGSAQYRISIHRSYGSDVRNLALRMNTGIGAA